MTKCDFCPNSHLKNGKLVCPYRVCMLTEDEWYEILDAIKGENDEDL